MKSYLLTYLMIGLLSIAIMGCKQPYIPPPTVSLAHYLVVDGVINTANDSTIIKLSRTVDISGKTTLNPENGALLTVESDQNVSYPLPATGNGQYASPSLNISNNAKYRLRIVTADGEQYLSDFAAPKANPQIDSVGFTTGNGGMQVYVNTHDPQNNTRYYRWDYQETWKFHSKYSSDYLNIESANHKALLARPVGQGIYQCYANHFTNTIVLGSSAKLQQDIIYQEPVTLVPPTSEKIETEYSILVRQYALSGDEFNFWQNLKKNTEQLGSIFDAQPSSLKGNIHNVNKPNEPVIGYIGVTNVQQKRVFILNQQLPREWTPVYPYDCQEDSAFYCGGRTCQNQVVDFIVNTTGDLATHSILNPYSGQVIGYLYTSTECADCTIRGTTKQPDFWRQ